MTSIGPTFWFIILVGVFWGLVISSGYFLVKAIRGKRRVHVRVASLLILLLCVFLSGFTLVNLILMENYHPDQSAIPQKVILSSLAACAAYFTVSTILGRFWPLRASDSEGKKWPGNQTRRSELIRISVH